MSTVEEILEACKGLSPAELAELNRRLATDVAAVPASENVAVWMALGRQFQNDPAVKAELRRIDQLIEEEFETVDPKDWE